MIESNLKQRLNVLRGTLRRAIVLNGSGRMLIAIVAVFFLAFFLDYFVFRWSSVNTGFRVVTLLGMIGTAGFIAWKTLLAPLSVPVNTDDMALAVEKEFPKLNDSLISTVQLTRMMTNDGSVSTPMVEEIARQAHAATAELDFSSVVKFDRIKPILVGAACAIAFTLTLAGIPMTRAYMQTAAARIFNPWSDAKYPVRTQVKIKDPGKFHDGVHEYVVPKNESHRIVAVVSGDVPPVAYIQFDYGNSKGYGSREPITTLQKTGLNETEFEFEYNPVLSSFDFIIVAGDNQTEKGAHKVTAVDRPSMDNLTVRYKLPAYISDKESDPVVDTRIRGVIGTQAIMSCKFNKPLVSAQLKLGDAEPVEMAASADKLSFTKTVELEKSMDYEIFLRDTDGLDNSKNKIRHKIIVTLDNLPQVTWRKPAVDLEVAPGATVPLELAEVDDYGLQKSLVKFKKYKTVVQPAPAGGQNTGGAVIDQSTPAVEGSFDLTPAEGEYGRRAQKLEFKHEWALHEMALQPGDLIEYWAEAYDWCPTLRKGEPPQVYKLKILSIEELLHILDVQRMRLVDDLIVIIRMQETDKKSVTALAEHLGFGNPFDNTQRSRLSEAVSLQEEARRKTAALEKAFNDLIGRYRSNGLDTPDQLERLRGVADQLNVEHTNKMPDAAKQITTSSMAKDDKVRIDGLKSAAVRQEEILDDLNKLLALMQKWAETEELLKLTRELLAKQRPITAETVVYKDKLGAKLPSEATKDELTNVKGLEGRERECAGDMKVLFGRMTSALAKMLELDKFVAKNIDDAIKIAQNTDATADNVNLATTGDTTPSIEEKMTAAQNDIARFSFGTAGGKQRACETALTRIIDVLSRRQAIDKKLLEDMRRAKEEAERILKEQKKLTERTKGVMDKQDLMRSIAEAKSQLNALREKESKVRDQTAQQEPHNNPEADNLDKELSQARDDLQNLINSQDKLINDTIAGLSGEERSLASSLNGLAELEIKERALAAESGSMLKDAPDNMTDVQRKKYEDAMNTHANNQADRQQELDLIIGKLQDMARAGNIEKPDPLVALAGKAAAKAQVELEASSADMGKAADTIRKGSPSASKDAAKTTSELQVSAADKIKKAREILAQASAEAAKDKKEPNAALGKNQNDTKNKTDALKNKLEKLGLEISKAHAGASGGLEKNSKENPAEAAGKVGEASKEMGDSKENLDKPNPAAAIRPIAKSMDLLEEAKKSLDNMQKKVDELKDPARQLARVQKEVKEATRQLADKIKNIDQQLPDDGKQQTNADQNMKKASDHMQNAENNLGKSSESKGGDSKSKSGDSKSGDSKSGDSKSGDSKSGDSKSGDSKSGDSKSGDSKSGDNKSGQQNQNNGNKGGDQKGDQSREDAKKEEDKALSELDKALAKLDALAEKAKNVGDDHKEAALKALQREQNALREDVTKLLPKIAEIKDKSGDEKAGKAQRAGENAQRNQSQASSQMGKGNQGEAQKSEEQAEEDLKDMLSNLDDVQKKAQDQQRKEKLFQIEQELKKMLDVQKGLYARTGEADKVSVPRAKKGMVKKIFEEQQELGNSVKVVVKKLEEAPVFQWVLQTAVDDMLEAASRLDKEDSGATTQQIQDDAAKKLADLIEALRKERTKPQQGGGGGGGGGGKQPLVPPVAQLKMLRIMQRYVNTAVKRIDEEVAKSAQEMTKDQKDRQRRAASQEGDIYRMMDKLIKEASGKSPKLEDGPQDPGGN